MHASWSWSIAGAALVGASLPVAAASFSAGADIIFQGERIDSKSAAGGGPQTVPLGPVSSADGNRSGNVSATATRGQVIGLVAAASAGGKVTSIAQAAATYDDVVFTFNGAGPLPAAVPNAVFNFEVAMTQSASGFLGSTGFNARELIWSASFMGLGTGGTVRFDAGGNSGQDQLRSHQLAATNVPIDAPVTIALSLFAGTQATQRLVGSPVATTVGAVIAIGAPAVGPASFAGRALASEPLGPEVFDLPDGFTVNSESMGVVDNHWVFAPAVPEPSTWALMAGGLMLLSAAAGRARRAGRRRAG